jgi:GBP family porin
MRKNKSRDGHEMAEQNVNNAKIIASGVPPNTECSVFTALASAQKGGVTIRKMAPRYAHQKLVTKTNLMALGFFACMPFTAHAQISVTVYGKIDLGINYIPNSNAKGQSLVEEKASTNRLGFRGNEDLGNGLSALFTLENGFNGDDGTTGQSGRLFGRQAFVGVQSKQAGTIMLGRQDTPMYDYLAPISAGIATWGGSAAAHYGDIDNVNAYFRVDNSLKYTSPVFNNASVGAFYGMGERTGGMGKNQTFGFGSRYSTDTLYLAAAMLHVSNPIESVYDGNLTTNTKGTFGSSIYAGLQAASALRTLGLAVGYNIGQKAKVALIVTDTRLYNSALAKGNAAYQNYEINGAYFLTPRLQIGAAYIFTNGHWSADDSHPRFNQVNVGASYAFSKGVSIYWRNTYQIAGGSARVAQINLLPASGNSRQFLTNVGLKYSF